MADYVHPLVAALVSDAASPPDLNYFTGYLGPSSEAGMTRLYLTLEMNAWVDVKPDQIVHTDHAPPTPERPWGEDVIWMSRRDARRLRERRSGPGDEAEPSSQPEPAGPERQFAVQAGTVVNVNVGTGGAPAGDAAQPAADDGGGTFGGGRVKGPRKKFG